MRITVSIDNRLLKVLQHATGESKKSPAVRAAILAFLRDEKKKRVIRKVLKGKTNYGLTNAELEARSSWNSR
jgi:metal-responsive CopG/Arc/MetJ family transcriptional regulator